MSTNSVGLRTAIKVRDKQHHKFRFGFVSDGAMQAVETCPAAARYSANIFADTEDDNTSIVIRVYGDTKKQTEQRRDFVITALNTLARHQA